MISPECTLEPLDPEWVKQRLSQYPFVVVSGVSNIRTLGSYPTRSPNASTRPGFLYRSADVSALTEQGKEQLRRLGISTVYDLRSDTEIEKYKTPPPEIDSVEVVRTPVFKVEDYSPEAMATRFQLYAKGTIDAFMELYTQILEHGGPSFGIILRHIRDRPSEGCLFHCTAGKDRTGVLSAILLSLAGVDDENIADDYELTRIGREPMREVIMRRLSTEPIFAKDKKAALNMLSANRKVALSFMNLIRTQFGGAEGYVKQFAGLSDEDLHIIKKNLIICSKL